MLKLLAIIGILVMLVGSSDATFKKRKGNKGEDAAAQGSHNTGKQVGHGQQGPHGSSPLGESGYANNHPYDYRRDPDDDDYPIPHRGRPHNRYHEEPSHNDYRRGPPPPRYNDDYGQSSPSHHGNHRPNNRPSPDYDGFHGEPSNPGPYFNRGPQSYDGYHRHPGSKRPHSEGHGGLYGSGSNHSPTFDGLNGGSEDEQETYRKKFYEDSEEEGERGSNAPKPDGQGEWVGVSGSSPFRGSSNGNGTLDGGVGKLSQLFSRTRTGIKKLLQLP